MECFLLWLKAVVSFICGRRFLLPLWSLPGTSQQINSGHSGRKGRRGSGEQGIRGSEDQEIRGSGDQGIRRSGDQRIRGSGKEKIPVHLAIYDIMGRLVVTLINHPQEPVIYQLPITSHQLPGSGIYFYRINVGAYGNTPFFTQSRKMVPVR